MIANFQIENKVGKPRFFQKTGLIVNTKFAIILEIFFLQISNTDIFFVQKTLI